MTTTREREREREDKDRGCLCCGLIKNVPRKLTRTHRPAELSCFASGCG